MVYLKHTMNPGQKKQKEKKTEILTLRCLFKRADDEDPSYIQVFKEKKKMYSDIFITFS